MIGYCGRPGFAELGARETGGVWEVKPNPQSLAAQKLKVLPV